MLNQSSIVNHLRDILAGKTLTRDEADEVIFYVQLCTPPVSESRTQSSSVFVISYDRSAYIGNPEKEAAEKLLGKVVWFQTEPGARPPQVSMFVKESK